MAANKHFDVIIIGGSYAGLSAAMALGRSLRKVLIIDSGLPCNRQTPHSHNFITQDGTPPQLIAEKARAQVLNYDTVQLYKEPAVSGKKTTHGFEITTGSGAAYHAKKLIFATGIKDLMPGIKGFASCWGISVIHCPYCHGYEFRNQPTGIMANGDRAFHLASLVRNLTNTVTILTSGKADFTKEQSDRLDQHALPIIETPVIEIEHEKGLLKNVIFEDGDRLPFKAVYAVLPFVQHSDIPVSLGCSLTEQGYIQVDAFQKTTVAGIFACGDSTSPMRSVADAVSTGNFAGAMANMELTNEQF